ncbi:MAG: hypothetical protein WC516_06225 [Patescibacteria group bacterium]|jgi:DNA modification methylase
MNNIEDFKNTIICGDCVDVMKDFPDNCIDLICIDPPYLVTNEKWDRDEIITDALSLSLEF